MKRINTKEYITNAKLVHGNKYNYDKTKFIKTRTKVIITCKKHGDFEQFPYKHLYGGGCRFCYYETRKHSNSTFITKANKKHHNKYTYTKTKYLNNYSKVTVTCKKHGDFTITPHAHLTGDQCSKCTISNRSDSNEVYIEKANKKHHNKYTYTKTKFKNTRGKITITCSKHGDFKQVASAHLDGSGCPVCKASKGEIKIINLLKDNKIKYIHEYSLIKGKSSRYDFYLPELNILIEYDGIQHFKAIEYWGGIKQLEKQKETDRNKNKLAELHNIPLIRIPYTKYNDLEPYLLWSIAKIYKYHIRDKFYKNFLELYQGEQLAPTTRVKDVKQYLTYKK